MPRLAKSQILWENFLTRSSNPPSQNSHPLSPYPSMLWPELTSKRNLGVSSSERGHSNSQPRGQTVRERCLFPPSSSPRTPGPPGPHPKFRLRSLRTSSHRAKRDASARPVGVSGREATPGDPPQRPVAVPSHPPSGPGASRRSSRASPLSDHARSGGAREAACPQGAQRSPSAERPSPLAGHGGVRRLLVRCLSPVVGSPRGPGSPSAAEAGHGVVSASRPAPQAALALSRLLARAEEAPLAVDVT